MAAFITKEIFSLTDILLDMHGGDVGEDLIPFICYYDNKEFDKQTKQVSKLSEISGFETIVCYPYTLADDQPAMYAFKQAVRQGIPSFSIELGKLGNSDKVEISFINEAIYRILKELKMYDNIGIKPTYGVKSKFSKQAYISVPVQGIFYSDLKAGDLVQKNQIIGYITDVFGNKISQILAPETGKILYKVGTPPVNVGETLLCIGFN